MKKLLFLVISISIFNACGSDEASKATLMKNTNPPLRYNPRTHTKTPSKIEENIKLLNAQTQAKASLARIEAQKAAKLKEIEAQKATQIARLEAQKAQKIKELELQKALSSNESKSKIAALQAKAQITIEKEKQANLLAKQKADLAFYRQLTAVIVVLLLVLMVFLYLLYRHRQNLKLKLHEEELRHQAYLQESRQHHERVTKMLEIIAHESTDKNLKKELTKLLKNADEKPIALPQTKK